MGEYLSSPNRDKKSEEAENGKVTSSPFTILLAKVRLVSHAGMEKDHGRFSHCKS
jgi:ribosomal protein L24